MNKALFLSALRARLTGLPDEDIEKSLDYYGEIIDDRVEDGLTEEEATEALGSVDEIVSQIIMEVSLPKLVKAKVKPQKSLAPWQIALLVLTSPVWVPLAIAAAAILFAVYIVLWAAIVVLYSVDISIAAGALAGIFGAFTYFVSGKFAQGALCIGAGLICAGCAILLFFLFNRITKAAVLLSKKILLSVKSLFVKKGDEQ